jgi:uncharacterized protein
MVAWLRNIHLLAAAGVCFSIFAADCVGAAPNSNPYFRIGTGGVAGTYFPIGSLIARGLTMPESSESCDPDTACGVADILAVAQISNGSVSNINSLASGELEAALVQADTAFWAYKGAEIFKPKGQLPSLRAIAALYPESLHIVVRRDSGIRSIRDLRGKRVSLDEPGSGTLIDSRILLAAHGLSENEIKPEYIKPALSAKKMIDGTLDAFLIFAGFPAPSIRKLSAEIDISLLPVMSSEIDKMSNENGFLKPSEIPQGVYSRIGRTPTLEVMALFVVRADASEDLVFEVTRSLWSQRTARLLQDGHPKGRFIRLETALSGVTIPFHPGAAKFYRDVGLNPDNGDK